MKLIEDARGRWLSILPALGVDRKFLTKIQGPCPMCGGKDRFRFDNKEGRGTFYCNQCIHGDGIDLVRAVRGWDLRTAAAEIERHVGISPAEPVSDDKMDPARALGIMRKIWGESSELGMIEATRLWWLHRAGVLPSTRELRATNKLLLMQDRSRRPGMIARIRSASGEPIGLHRTYLTAAGAKAPILKPRMIFGGYMGGAVRLARPTDVLGIAEGIETAVSATLLFDVPCWAVLSATNMPAWQPPPGVRLIIFADRDAHGKGLKAAKELAGAMVAEGRQVEIRAPDIEGTDWNDVRRATLKEPARMTA